MDKDWPYHIDQSWTLFLDRDGVINKKIPNDYVKSVEEFEILPGVMEALFRADKLFLYIFVVTNQQGIGKELMSHEDLYDIHSFLIDQTNNAQGRIDQIYYSPDLAYLDSLTRKPAPGMALQAQEDYPLVDFSKSIMVGDSQSDIDFGHNLGMKTIWINHSDSLGEGYHEQFSSLLDFIKWVEDGQKKANYDLV